jgi:ABC-type proline/glycine betaine transport system ATPase subunit
MDEAEVLGDRIGIMKDGKLGIVMFAAFHRRTFLTTCSYF